MSTASSTKKVTRVYPSKDDCPKSHAIWKKFHDTQLRSLARKGLSNEQIAAILKRSEASVRNRKNIIGISSSKSKVTVSSKSNVASKAPVATAVTKYGLNNLLKL